MLDLWRICKAKHAATAFSGTGSDKVGGRWNPKECPMVYTSESPAVATLELFVHTDPDLLPPMVLIHATLEVDEWYMGPEDLPKNWRANPAPRSLQLLGKEWLEAETSVALMVPSVPAVHGWNILLNPVHRDMRKLKIISTEEFRFDNRMYKQ